MSAAGAAVRETVASLRTVARNPGLRRVNLAFAGSMVGDWAYATAVAVWAYSVGGATAVAAWSVVRLGLLAAVTPLASTLADRFPRTRVMVVSDLIRGTLVLVAAAGVYWHWPALAIFALATVAFIAGAPYRPCQLSLLPLLTNQPEELTAANGVASTVESLAFFVGPALGGLLLAVANIPSVFVVDAASFVWSAALVAGVRPAARPEAAALAPSGQPAGGEADRGVGHGAADDALDEATPGVWRQSVAGFAVINRDARLRLVTALYCAQTVVAGASGVIVVALAESLVHLGSQGVGYLNAVFGVGAVVGGIVAVGRAGRPRLARDFGVGVILWALPLVLITAWPTVAVCVAALAISGAANPVVDVNASTILQRITPDAVMGRVFGALDTLLMGTMALGALIMPLLIRLVGLRASLAVLGVAVTVVVLPTFGALRRLDAGLAPPPALALLGGVPLLAPLSLPLLESLARQSVPVSLDVGDQVIREGESGDRFYVIESGLVRVSHDGRELRTEGPGEFFGEIALLRDIPRTATVTALAPTTLYALDREHFLAALTGSTEAQTAADDIIGVRLRA